jgi:putative holliday junction resolvase
MAIAALDLGKKRIGLAVTDDSETRVFPIGALERKGSRFDFAAIARRLHDYTVSRFVVGLPLNMDGSEGSAARSARTFAERLGAALNVPVHLFDERLTSFEAEDRLKGADVPRRSQKGAIDAVAAAVILEGWLAMRTSDGNPR